MDTLSTLRFVFVLNSSSRRIVPLNDLEQSEKGEDKVIAHDVHNEQLCAHRLIRWSCSVHVAFWFRAVVRPFASPWIRGCRVVDGSSVQVSMCSSSAGLVFMVFTHSGMNMRKNV